MLKNLILIILFTGLSISAYAQSLQGTVTDGSSGETVPTANVVVLNGTTIVKGGVTDFDGKFKLAPIAPGSYTVKISFIGYATKTIKDVPISGSKASTLNVQLYEESSMLTGIVLEDEAYENPLIDPDKQGETLGKDKIASMPTRDLGQIAASGAGVSSKDQGQGLNVKGGRDGEVTYFVDGVKVTGSTGLPNSALDQIQVITGGVPAEYGDVASGVISIVTRGPSSHSFGGVDVQSSQFLDNFGYNLAEFYYSTPLMQKKDEEGNKTPLVGVFLSGNYTTIKDAGYYRHAYKVSDAKLAEIQANPLLFGGTSFNPIVAANAETITAEDIEKTKYLDNNRYTSINGQIKFDIKLGNTSRLKVGGNLIHTDDSRNTLRNNLINSDNVLNGTTKQYRLFATFQQFFSNGDEEDKSTIENAYYTLHTDYTNYNSKFEDEDHGDNYFRYGYSGKFTPQFADETDPLNFDLDKPVTYTDNSSTGNGEEVTENVEEIVDGVNTHVFNRHLKLPTTFTFTPSDINPDKSSLAESYFDYLSPFAQISFPSLNNAGISNGSGVSRLHGLFDGYGNQPVTNQKFVQNQFRFTGATAGSVKGHDIKIGFEFEQRVRSLWSIRTDRLWSTARNLQNEHLFTPDVYYTWDGSVTEDDQKILTEFAKYDESNVSAFAKNLRNKLGGDLNQTIYVDEFNPDDLTIDLFSAEELLNNRIATNYYGYDAFGNSLGNENITFNDFLTDSLANGSLKREVGAFQPIYMAGYIQDKFIISDLVFNVGVRVDRYDANQPVPVDPYIIFDHKTAGEVDFNTFNNYSKPTNIGDDYAVYVDDAENPTKIVGYRKDNVWYNAQGELTTDILDLSGKTGAPEPFLTDDAKSGLDENNGLTDAAFTEYEPQVVVMPRVAFNFPISDEALFFAHYDVLTQRPTAGNSIFNPNMYLDLAKKLTSGVSEYNPNLKMQRNTDYELGFKQTLTENTALEFSLYYREMRDMIQLYYRRGAYPISYMTYDNIDFGTTKGLTLKYEQRKGGGNLGFTANYTLQFADGTGSGSDDARQIATNPLVGNIRQTLPLSFDTRHQINATVDYSFKTGKRYNGPKKLKKVLEGMSFGLQATGFTGTPYTKRSAAIQTLNLGVGQNPVQGSVNGARLPFSHRLDLKVTKRFALNRKDNKKPINMSAYVQINNLLNTGNILNVYGYTGSESDDGWLASNQGDSFAKSKGATEQAYRDLYNSLIDNPRNLSRPRTIRLGLTFGF